jgi:hypothetical protein
MARLIEQSIGCPHCGESIGILIDDSLPEQQYVEDCQICCRPIVLDITADEEGDVTVRARAEND